MALITCPKCGSSISSFSKNCIYCGTIINNDYNNAPYGTDNTNNLEQNMNYNNLYYSQEIVPNNSYNKYKSTKIKNILIILGSLVFFVFWGFYLFFLNKWTNRLGDNSKNTTEVLYNTTEIIETTETTTQNLVTHKKTIAEWNRTYTTSDSTWSVQPSLSTNANGEVTGTVNFKFYMETYPNLSINDPEVKQAFLDAMDDLMFGLKTDLEADGYTISEVKGVSSQYNVTKTIP